MDLDTIIEELEKLTTEQYGYLGLAAIFGPLLMKLFGFRLLGALVRPVALALILGGIYARNQRGGQQQ